MAAITAVIALIIVLLQFGGFGDARNGNIKSAPPVSSNPPLGLVDAGVGIPNQGQQSPQGLRITVVTRLKGQLPKDWTKHLQARPDADVELGVLIDNDRPLKGVVVRFELEDGLVLNATSVRLVDGNFPAGHTYEDGERIIGPGISIGNMNAGINAYVVAYGKVSNAASCGRNSFSFTSTVEVSEPRQSLRDTASITTVNDC